MLWSKGSAILAPGCSGQRFLLIHVLFVFVATHFNIHFGAWHRSALAINRSGLGSTLVQRGMVGGRGRQGAETSRKDPKADQAGRLAGRQVADTETRLPGEAKQQAEQQYWQQQQHATTTTTAAACNNNGAPSTEHRTPDNS